MGPSLASARPQELELFESSNALANAVHRQGALAGAPPEADRETGPKTRKTE
jgi:hypothetical protein